MARRSRPTLPEIPLFLRQMKLEGEYYTFVYGRAKYKIPIAFRDQVISHWQDNPNSDAEQWLLGLRDAMRRQVIVEIQY